MKTFSTYMPLAAIVSLAISSLFAFSACSTSTTTATGEHDNNRPPLLQVQVTVPPTMDPIRSQDVEDAFGDRVATALHEQGLHGRVQVLSENDDPKPGIPLLSVNLTEWRVDPVGNVNCTFNADLKTSQGERNLGQFIGTSMLTWADRGWFARSNTFTDAAGSAMNDLWPRIQASGILPNQPAAAAH